MMSIWANSDIDDARSVIEWSTTNKQYLFDTIFPAQLLLPQLFLQCLSSANSKHCHSAESPDSQIFGSFFPIVLSLLFVLLHKPYFTLFDSQAQKDTPPFYIFVSDSFAKMTKPNFQYQNIVPITKCHIYPICAICA